LPDAKPVWPAPVPAAARCLRPVKMGQLPHARITGNTPSSGRV